MSKKERNMKHRGSLGMQEERVGIDKVVKQYR